MKVLEDELMSLAHRILKLRNRAEIHELKEQAAVLYEKLSVLSFTEKHFEGFKPTIKKHDVEKAIEADYSDEHQDFKHPDGTEYSEDQIYEHNTEKIKDIVSQMPYESEQVDEMFKENTEDNSKNQPQTEDNVQDFGVHFDDLPDFEPAPEQKETDDTTQEDDKKSTEPNDQDNDENQNKNNNDDSKKEERTIDLFSQNKKSLNDSLNKTLKIGLNDRLTFVNQLFKGETKAYERFIKNINSFESIESVKSYIEQLLSGEYSFWKDKEETFKRLMHIINKKFS
jgi:hypothetical protein